MKTASQLTRQEIESYRKAAHQRQAQEKVDLERRRERAWVLARQAAALLRNDFGAARVVVFGSLAREQFFTHWSDVDLAVWGLQPEDTFRAMTTVYDLDGEILLNLVDVNVTTPSLLKTIEKTGIDL